MAHFPKIDSPCPLSREEQSSLDGHCGRCGKTVHCLDALDDGGREEFLRKAKGPVCVSYRLPVMLGASLALTAAAPTLAADASQPKDRCPIPAQASAATPTQSPIPAGSSSAVTTPATPEKVKPIEYVSVFMGGVHDPAGAKWVEDTSLPELPTAPDDTPAR
jgi:hypothetical protein